MVNSVHKASLILELLARESDLGVPEVSERLGLARSTVYKIILTLERGGLVERRTGTSRFHLGLKLVELGSRAQLELDIFRTAHPFIQGLNETSTETVHLTVLDGVEVLYVDCVESTRRLRTYSVIGVRAPLYCTAVGKATLAYQDEAILERVVEGGLAQRTPHTITNSAALREDLARTRERGFAIDDRENDELIRCIGAPVRSADGSVTMALSVSGPSERVTPERVTTLAPAVIAAADGISARLGYRPATPRSAARETGARMDR